MTDLKIPFTVLQQDVATRWNSTFYMLKSLVAHKKALAVYAVEYELPATQRPPMGPWLKTC